MNSQSESCADKVWNDSRPALRLLGRTLKLLGEKGTFASASVGIQIDWIRHAEVCQGLNAEPHEYILAASTAGCLSLDTILEADIARIQESLRCLPGHQLEADDAPSVFESLDEEIEAYATYIQKVVWEKFQTADFTAPAVIKFFWNNFSGYPKYLLCLMSGAHPEVMRMHGLEAQEELLSNAPLMRVAENLGFNVQGVLRWKP